MKKHLTIILILFFTLKCSEDSSPTNSENNNEDNYSDFSGLSVEMMLNYSSLNKNTSWYITNQRHNYLDLRHSGYRNMRYNEESETFQPLTNWGNEERMWFHTIGSYLYADFNNDGAKEIWQTFLKAPWPSDRKEITMYSAYPNKILDTNIAASSENFEGHFTLTQTRKAVLSDLNKDGSLEIVMFSHGLDSAEGNGDSLAVFYPANLALNQPSSYKYLDRVGYWHGGAVGDIDNNGFPDIVAYNSSNKNNDYEVYVYFNNGQSLSGSRSDINRITGDANMYTVELFDLNKDSNLDLVLSRDENITILWGDGSGTYDWQNKLIYISPNYNQGHLAVDIDFLDFNLDGSVDLLLNYTDYNGMYIKVISIKDNIFQDLTPDLFLDETSIYDYGFWAVWLIIKDINGDGFLDILADGILSTEANNFPHTGESLYWLNNTQGKFNMIRGYSSIASP
ncbi:VCBS repeat-containing protein [Candidatus Marinimicrobia bacterium]|nr:VCBS repeat-containing protein [Candidatus Neomarinimicrobiota bacterium]